MKTTITFQDNGRSLPSWHAVLDFLAGVPMQSSPTGTVVIEKRDENYKVRVDKAGPMNKLKKRKHRVIGVGLYDLYW